MSVEALNQRHKATNFGSFGSTGVSAEFRFTTGHLSQLDKGSVIENITKSGVLAFLEKLFNRDFLIQYFV